MGCDIHLYIEVKGEDGWSELTVPIFKDPYEAITKKESYSHRPDTYRNYSLFALLADVRNTNQLIQPIKPQEGLPPDISEELKAEYEPGSLDWHSATYYTLDELLEYEWNKVQVEEVDVNAEGYKEYIEKGIPSSWTRSSNTSFDKDKVKKMHDAYISGTGIPGCIKMERSDMERHGHFYFNILMVLKHKLAPKVGGSKNIRIIMWFDN